MLGLFYKIQKLAGSTMDTMLKKKIAVKTQYVSDIPVLINDLKKGKMIILMDAADRENEGDLV